MAEILIRAIDNTSPDPEKDKMMYKTGYVVCVRPDGWPWSDAERDTTQFWIITLPGEDAEIWQTDLTKPLIDPNDERRILQRRSLLLNIPSPIKTALNNGPVVLTVQQINALRTLVS